MAKPFNELRERLLRAGVAPRHVRRYLTELTDHLADLRAEEERAGRSRADAESAALVRLGGMDELSKAMIEQRQFQSWCVRAPWAMFGLAPLFASGWSLVRRPFHFVVWLEDVSAGSRYAFRLRQCDGFANLYFQADRAFYFGAPILIGWGIGLIAARQRLKAVWPIAGLVLIALIGGTAGVSRESHSRPRRIRTYHA